VPNDGLVTIFFFCSAFNTRFTLRVMVFWDISRRARLTESNASKEYSTFETYICFNSDTWRNKIILLSNYFSPSNILISFKRNKFYFKSRL
jgi:hypothetical protein